MSKTDGDKKFSNRFIAVILGLTTLYFILVLRSAELFFHSPLPTSIRPSEEPVRRGLILDSEGHELAITLQAVSIGARPAQITDPQKTARALASKLSLSENEILSLITARDKPFLYVQRKTDSKTAEELKKLNLPGIVFEDEPNRFYPNDHLASTVIGFTGIDHEGLSGIEYQYNADLTTNDGDSHTGRSVYLTINAYIQYSLEKALRESFTATGAKSAIGIVSETATGKILAIASLPDFNPNKAADYPEANYRNRAVSDLFEPGSTFKMFTVASLLKEGLLDEKKTYYCPGFFEHSGKKVKCWASHGEQNIREVIQHSCNTGVIEAAWVMPVTRFHENLRAFGIGQLTDIDLPGESNGNLPPPKSWDMYLKMSIPIGHGLSVTGIQTITAANALANGGYLQKPLLVDRIVTNEGREVRENSPHKRIKIISDENGKQVLDYLESVVSGGGTGVLASIADENLKVCGKTGTAIKSDSTGYHPGHYQASFIGFYPCNAPEVTIFILLDDPQGEAYQGGQVAAPVFRRVLEPIIANVHKGKVQPVKPLPGLSFFSQKYDPMVMPNLLGKSKKEVMSIVFDSYAGDHKINGRGYLSAQNPPPGTQIQPPYSFTLDFSFP